MSRCYPFPPPGYVKSAPLELELSTKREKRKHKDKKKKRKKHSAANGDLTIKEDDQQCKVIEQSGRPYEGFSVGNDKLPSATKSQGAIQRLQTETCLDEAFSNRNLTTDSQRFKPREELLSRSMLAAERSEAEESRDHVLSKGVNASSSKRSEQAESSVFANGVLSTKRKRLQADNAGDGLLPKSVLDASYRKSDGLQTGKSRPGPFMQATADNFGNQMTSDNGLPSDFERSAKRLRADHTRLKVGTNGVSSAIGQEKNGKVPFHLLANDGDSQEDKLKPDVQLNGVMVTNWGKLQMNSFNGPQPTGGSLTTAKRDKSDKGKQPGKLSLMNHIQDCSMSNSSVNRLIEKVRPGSSMASKCQRSDQVLQGATNVLTTAGLKAEDKRLEADNTKGKVGPPDARATCEERSNIDSTRRDMRVLDVKIKPDSNGQSVLATHYKHTGHGSQVDGFKNRVLSNGILAGHSEKQDQSNMNLSSPVPTAVISNNRAAPITALSLRPKVQLDFEDKSLKEKLLKLRVPHPGQALVTMEDEDWLVPCKQQLHSKQGEKGEEAQIQQLPDVACSMRCISFCKTRSRNEGSCAGDAVSCEGFGKKELVHCSIVMDGCSQELQL
ncbi:hypothetical protein GOP47_0013482 [Adiantum capillus-veneris]|uniref:Uncharacterized protein n=1 Tax=Adiantum capillus-veneris TaxID=13818 RepID=A0A9D4ZFT6_ADICA|nr:hypothetical protein GOP47_0013482 [Adiantum capillus-veneris]